VFGEDDTIYVLEENTQALDPDSIEARMAAAMAAKRGDN
jgi:hypothetical protein